MRLLSERSSNAYTLQMMIPEPRSIAKTVFMLCVSVGQVFTAPTYVPRTVHQLGFLVSGRSSTSSPVQPLLLVIPSADMPQADIWEMMGLDADAMATQTVGSAASCGVHPMTSRGRMGSRPSLSAYNRGTPTLPQVAE